VIARHCCVNEALSPAGLFDDKLKHPRASQANNGCKAAPVLEFEYLLLGGEPHRNALVLHRVASQRVTLGLFGQFRALEFAAFARSWDRSHF